MFISYFLYQIVRIWDEILCHTHVLKFLIIIYFLDTICSMQITDKCFSIMFE